MTGEVETICMERGYTHNQQKTQGGSAHGSKFPQITMFKTPIPHFAPNPDLLSV